MLAFLHENKMGGVTSSGCEEFDVWCQGLVTLNTFWCLPVSIFHFIVCL